MPRSVWKVREGSGAYYGRYWKKIDMKGNVQKGPEA